VVKSASWAEGGSQLGVDAAGNTVFEPRDPQKGNTARAIFYFYTVYGVNGGVDLENFRIEEDTLRRWNQQDPPDAAELRRNDLVFAAQGNRNPFVDHPEWINAAGEFMDQAQKLRRGR
jgi:endonuclease I